MNFLQKNGRGILVCLVMAVPCWLLGQKFPIVGGPVFGILAGMIVTLLWHDKTAAQSGISFVSKKVLQYAVILLGFGMNLSVIWQTGKQSLPIIVVTITTSLVVSWLLHKLMHIPGKISTLVGVGSSICGGSAVAATASVIDADDEEVAQAISVIFFFNMLAAIFFPALGALLGFSTTNGEAFGIFAGTAINDTSSVTAAASTWDSLYGLGSQTLDKAVTVKLTRHAGHHPDHARARLRAHEARQDRRHEGGSQEDLPDVHPLLPARVRDHDRVRERGRVGKRVRPAQDAQQVSDRDGHVRRRTEHEHRQARQDRRKAAHHGLLLLVGIAA